MTLRRNEKVDGAVKSICELEYRFNHRYGYPWVFNEVGFTRFFTKSVHCVASRLIRLKASRSSDLKLVANGEERYHLWVRHGGLRPMSVLMNTPEAPRTATPVGSFHRYELVKHRYYWVSSVPLQIGQSRHLNFSYEEHGLGMSLEHNRVHPIFWPTA